LIKSRYIYTIVSSLLPLFLYGCIQPLLNTNTAVLKSNSAVSAEGATKDNTDRKSALYAHNKPNTAANTDNRFKEPESNNTISSENNIDDNSSPEKKIQSVMDEALDFCQASQYFWQKGELDDAVEALDQAYSLIWSAETYDEPNRRPPFYDIKTDS
jgi:membrane-bound lytic murein transglycosylase D